MTLPPLRRLLLVLCLGLLAACRSAPVQEMSEARQAIEAARAVGAEQYAPDKLEQALSSLREAEQMLNDRRFRDARRSARRARDQAIDARQSAQSASGGD